MRAANSYNIQDIAASAFETALARLLRMRAANGYNIQDIAASAFETALARLLRMRALIAGRKEIVAQKAVMDKRRRTGFPALAFDGAAVRTVQRLEIGDAVKQPVTPDTTRLPAHCELSSKRRSDGRCRPWSAPRIRSAACRSLSDLRRVGGVFLRLRDCRRAQHKQRQQTHSCPFHWAKAH
jgi:hypothetical protein